MASFGPPDSTPGNWHSNQFARTTARDYLHGNQQLSPITVALDIFQHHTAEIERQNGIDARDKFVGDLRDRIYRTPDFGVFPRDPGPDLDYDRALHERVMVPLTQRAESRAGSRKSRANSFNGNPAALVTMAMKRAGKLPHELTSDDIVRALHYEGVTLGNTISEVFAAYKLDQYDWAHEQFESDTGPVRLADSLGRVSRAQSPSVGHASRGHGNHAPFCGFKRPVRFRLFRPRRHPPRHEQLPGVRIQDRNDQQDLPGSLRTQSPLFRREDPHGALPRVVQPETRKAPGPDSSSLTSSTPFSIPQWSQLW